MSTIGFINVSLETFGGLLSLIFIICLAFSRPRKERIDRRYIRLLACNTALLFCDAAAWLFKGRPDRLSVYTVRVSNFLVFLLGYVLLVLFTHYLVSFLEAKNARVAKTPFYIMCGVMLFAAALLILSQWNHMYYRIDENNVYHRQGWFWLSQAFGVAGLLVNGGVVVRYRKWLNGRELTAFGTYIVLPAAALVVQMMFYGVAVLYLATTICLLCIYIGIQMELSREIGSKELELEKGRTAIMLSQIQPHFLYNALLGIKELCDTQPKRASDALEHFSLFLRGNLDALSNTGLIPFETELRHVQDYLYLEKMRFEERVCVEWDIEFRNFALPPLVLQPIVENAIRLGIAKKMGGGTIWIRSEACGDTAVVTVRDNGAGFDAGEQKKDGRTHVGVENVRKRIELQCGGVLQVESEKGVGTEVKLIFPRRKAE